MAKIKDITGKTFGLLRVEAVSGKKGDEYYWNCKCKCGNSKEARGSHLRAGSIWRCDQCEHLARRKERLAGGITNYFWECLKRNAKKRSRVIEIEITPTDAWELLVKQQFRCNLTGVEIDLSETAKSGGGTASLDRIDSTKGYTKDNIQWLHKVVNKMKMELGQTEFLNWCRKVTQHDSSRPAQEEVD